MQTERQKQEAKAKSMALLTRTYHYRCIDGAIFSAIAITEAAAFRVLNSERPGMQATYQGYTSNWEAYLALQADVPEEPDKAQ
jgi:hypothetical protein